jgi:serine/threonine protein kinase
MPHHTVGLFADALQLTHAPLSLPRHLANAPVADLHSVLNVVHRDIKIDNIFVSFKGRVKLGDLGTACLMSGLAEATVAGTPLYLAPEALNCASWNEPGYGDRLDIFATSITICEIFTNCTPYEELVHKFSKAQEL